MKLLSNIIKAGVAILKREDIVSIGDVSVLKSNSPEADPEPSPTDQELAELAKDIIKESKEEALAIKQKAKKEAEQIVNKARDESEKLLEDARKKAEEEATQIKQQAYDAGYQEAYAKAEAEGEKIKAQANKVLSDAKKARADMEASMEPDMVKLVAEALGKLVSDMAVVNPGVIVNLIRQGLSETTLTGEVFVHVSPQDYERALAEKASLLKLTGGTVRLEIKSDPSLNPLDCMIETPYGNIDCSLDQQFEALKSNLYYILKSK